jgi:hypothetical protein
MMQLYKGRHQVMQQFVITSNNSQEGFAEILLQKSFSNNIARTSRLLLPDHELLHHLVAE